MKRSESDSNNRFDGKKSRRTLDAKNIIREVIVIGVWPADREREYIRPEYERYSKFLATELKLAIDRDYRTLPGAERCAVMGSSLGGVVSPI